VPKQRFHYVVVSGGQPVLSAAFPDAAARDRAAHDVLTGEDEAVAYDVACDDLLTLHVSAGGVPTVGTFSSQFAAGPRP